MAPFSFRFYDSLIPGKAEHTGTKLDNYNYSPS